MNLGSCLREWLIEMIVITGFAGRTLGVMAFWYYREIFQDGTILTFVGANRQAGQIRPPAHLDRLGRALLDWNFLYFLVGTHSRRRFSVLFCLQPHRGPCGVTSPELADYPQGLAHHQNSCRLPTWKVNPARALPLNSARGHPIWNHLVLVFVLVDSFNTELIFSWKTAAGEMGENPRCAGPVGSLSY